MSPQLLMLFDTGSCNWNFPFGTDSQDTMEQIKGLALVPKRSMDVMECEVDRLMLMTKNCIIPISYCVPRKVHEPLNHTDEH